MKDRVLALRHAMERSGALAKQTVQASISPHALQIARREAMERSSRIARQIVEASVVPWRKP